MGQKNKQWTQKCHQWTLSNSHATMCRLFFSIYLFSIPVLSTFSPITPFPLSVTIFSTPFPFYCHSTQTNNNNNNNITSPGGVTSLLLILARSTCMSRGADWLPLLLLVPTRASCLIQSHKWTPLVLRFGGEKLLPKMRRRAADFRRPVRRRFAYWIWLLLGAFSLAGLVLFFLQHHHREHSVHRPFLVKRRRTFLPLFSTNQSISINGSVFVIYLSVLFALTLTVAWRS